MVERYPETEADGFDLTLLGGFGLSWRGASLHVTQAAERLLAFLALRSRPVQRLYLAGTLWPESTEQHAVGCLRSALWRIRRVGRLLVEARGESLQLAGNVRVDLYDITERARRLVRGGPVELGDFAAIVPATELLPDLYDDWVLVERERHRQLRMHALEVLCLQLSATGRHGDAIEAGLAAVHGEPLRESAHGALIRAHLAEGNRSEAMRQYDRYCTVLRQELGLRPSPEIQRLTSDEVLLMAVR